MKHLLYFLFFLIVCSLKLNANDDYRPEASTEELRHIMAPVLPGVPPYDEKGDLVKYSDSISSHFSARSLSNDALSPNKFLQLPVDLVLYLLQFVDVLPLHRFGTTCKTFHSLIRAEGLILNDYCLQGLRPFAMPLDVLVRKTKNSKDGILRLLSNTSVSLDQVLAWFGEPYLQVVRNRLGTLPDQLEDKTEEELAELYPLIRLNMALTAPAARINLIAMSENVDQIKPLTFTRVLLINDVFPIVGINILYRVLGWLDDVSTTFVKSHHKIDLGINLLSRGFHVADVNHRLNVRAALGVRPDAQSKEIALKIIQWCCDHLFDFENAHRLVMDAEALGRPDLAFQIVNKLIDLPNTEQYQFSKCRIFPRYVDDKRVRFKIHRFARELSGGWQNLPTNLYGDAARLFTATGFPEQADAALMAWYSVLEDPEHSRAAVYAMSLEDALYFWEHKNDENALRQLTRQFVAEPKSTTFFRELIDRLYALNIHRVALIAGLKEAIELVTSMPSISRNDINYPFMEVLFKLASIEKERGGDVAYLKQQGDKLYKLMQNLGVNMLDEISLAILYYHLGEKEPCQTHYQRWCTTLGQEVQGRRLNIPRFLEMLSLPLESVLENLDPFLVIDLYLKNEKDRGDDDWPEDLFVEVMNNTETDI